MKYEAKVKYTRINEISGKEQTVSESYIVNDAETFADAEEQTFKYMAERTPSTVMAAIKISDVADIIDPTSGNDYFKCKVQTSVIDEVTGKDAKGNVVLLINAIDFNHAVDECTEWMKDSIVDCELVGVSKTKIIDII
jgi:hypothetical protein